MSAARGRQRRAERDWREHVLQAHDRLHKDEVDACHELLHAALGLEEPLIHDVAPLIQRAEFDADFRALCLRHGARASFVLIDRWEDERGARLISGGDADLVALIDGCLR